MLVTQSRQLTARLKKFMSFFKERRVEVRPVELDRLIPKWVQLNGRPPIAFDFFAEPEGIEILSDEILLTEIFDNLFQNAVRHARSKVSVRLAKSDQWVHVDVMDDGPGIAPQSVEKIFRPFFTTSADGHGLGLFISKLWAQTLGGQLELVTARHPQLGGCVFRLVLPARE